MGGFSRRALAIILLVAMPLMGSASSASEPPGGWYEVGAFKWDQGWFRVSTNSFGGTQLSSTGFLSSGNGTTQEEQELGSTLEYVWGARCKKTDAQTVTLSRTVFLPGAPKKLQVSLSAWLGSLVKNNPITSIAIKVNGTTIHEVLKAHAPIPTTSTRTLVDVTSYADEFRYGENTITLVAQKKATKKPLCTYSSDDRFAIGAELYGEFSADMTSDDGSATANQKSGALVPITITNNGPTDFFPGAGSFQIWVASRQVTISNIVASNVGSNGDTTGNLGTSGDCTTFNYSPGNSDLGSGKMLQCPLPRVAPGESLRFSVLISWSGFDCPGDIVNFGYRATDYLPGVMSSNDGRENGGFICADVDRR